ncbi:hypothetical protein LH29_01895 [Draconibacterium sediminis]|uniref:Uncharacterized protein n=1 Tax=Draconibacterium sediminis TaxID=1544798 RepID=A0A0D8JCP1_9BACT|nr:hypothetical protein LH29_01895 [Draconibacterium sediminis]
MTETYRVRIVPECSIIDISYGITIREWVISIMTRVRMILERVRMILERSVIDISHGIMILDWVRSMMDKVRMIVERSEMIRTLTKT